jgi:hypothetical protein
MLQTMEKDPSRLRVTSPGRDRGFAANQVSLTAIAARIAMAMATTTISNTGIPDGPQINNGWLGRHVKGHRFRLAWEDPNAYT